MPARLDKPKAHNRPPAVEGDWITIGWQGVSLRVPEDWSPVSVSAEGETGYLRIASPDTRSVEIKWEEARGTVSVPEALERYLKKLRRAARKSRQELTVKLRPRSLSNLRPPGQAPSAYRWVAEGPNARHGCGVVWHCGECRRMVIAELLGGLEDDLSLAAPVLKSVEEHGRDGWNTWGMYGLVMQVPDDYKIEGYQLLSGYLKFAFRRKASRLMVERWGLANIALKGVTVRDWFLGREAQRLSRFKFKVEEIPWRGHPVLRLSG